MSAERQFIPIPPERASFSYIRLGDGEVEYLLGIAGRRELLERGRERVDAPTAFYSRGVRGLPDEHMDRFLACIQRASFVDLCAGVSAFQDENLERAIQGLSFAHAVHDCRENSNLIIPWTVHSLGALALSRKVVIVGSEGDILAALLAMETYGQIWTSHYGVPPGRICSFTLPDQGLDVDLKLEGTKAYIAALLGEHEPDVLLLSAGTAGKILTVELAEEHRLPVLDFGACLRGLTYSGSPGYRAVRMDYIPHILRLPIGLYMSALVAARPEMGREEMFVRTLCQVMLAGVGKTVGRMCPLESYDRGWLDLSAEARLEFQDGWDYVRKSFGSWRSWSPLMKDEWARFESWATWTGIRPHARWHQQVDRVRRRIRTLVGKVRAT